jgi:GNAT superfamily N-acetyltransferase
VMCFVVHPEHRHRGVATALLTSVDHHLRDLGMTTAEGYPRAAPPADPDFPWTAASYKGTRAMYEQAGYHLHRTHDRFLVMRKAL